MSKKLLIIISIVLICSMAQPAMAQHELKDLGEDFWSEPFVERLLDLGVMSGYSDNTFRPKDEISKGEAAKVISTALRTYRIIPKPDTNKKSFNDIDNHWSKEFVLDLVNLGYILPEESNYVYNPNQAITRKEVATILMRILGFKDNGSITKTRYTDDMEISPNDKFYIELATEIGLMNGYANFTLGGDGVLSRTDEGNYFRPERPVTRGELATMVSRAIPLGASKVLNDKKHPYSKNTPSPQSIIEDLELYLADDPNYSRTAFYKYSPGDEHKLDIEYHYLLLMNGYYALVMKDGSNVYYNPEYNESLYMSIDSHESVGPVFAIDIDESNELIPYDIMDAINALNTISPYLHTRLSTIQAPGDPAAPRYTMGIYGFEATLGLDMAFHYYFESIGLVQVSPPKEILDGFQYTYGNSNGMLFSMDVYKSDVIHNIFFYPKSSVIKD